jgi:glycosyltransferase involved in cell wall biosynthesis
MIDAPEQDSTGEVMKAHTPRVSIGLPVYNGENYMEQAIDSVLAQTFTDFELIISDNASTDRTEEICQSYAARDSRIRYVRNETNLGATKNYNQTFELAQGEYFKWAAHDDLISPSFLERCVALLDETPSASLCYARAMAIDEHGQPQFLHYLGARHYNAKPLLMSPIPHKRFYQCVAAPYPQAAIFGLMRTSILRQTRLIGSYQSSDLVLLGELALRGEFCEVPEVLQFRRLHPERAWKLLRSRSAREAWYSPERAKKKTRPFLRLFREHFTSIQRAAPTYEDQLWCAFYVLLWAGQYWLFEQPLKRSYRLYRSLRGIEA